MRDIETGWNNYYSISNSKVMYCGSMICHKCKGKISGDYLIQDRSNYLLRGNEHDERYLFHRKCSDDNEKWIENDLLVKEQNKMGRQRAKQVSQVKTLIEKFGLSANELFDDEINS